MDLPDGWGAWVKLNAHTTVVMQLKSYEHLMYIQFWPCPHWVHQDLVLRQSKIKSIKKYWSLLLTDLKILCKWTINVGERYPFRHLVFFILGLVFLCKLSYSNNKLIFFSPYHSRYQYYWQFHALIQKIKNLTNPNKQTLGLLKQIYLKPCAIITDLATRYCCKITCLLAHIY